MTDQRTVDRRTVLRGTVALGVTASVAGCSSLPFVGDDDSSSAHLTYGDEISGQIVQDGQTSPDRGMVAQPHTFEGSAGDVVRITMDSEDVDTRLVLVDSDGVEIGHNDDRSMESFDSTIQTRLPEDGTYTIWAGSFSGVATGSYTLALELQ